jgi:hypothetical protein
MTKINLIDAVELLKSKGLEISGGNFDSLSEFIVFFERVYLPKMNKENTKKYGAYFLDDINALFNTEQ